MAVNTALVPAPDVGDSDTIEGCPAAKVARHMIMIAIAEVRLILILNKMPLSPAILLKPIKIHGLSD
jgi:hypothetical protein